MLSTRRTLMSEVASYPRQSFAAYDKGREQGRAEERQHLAAKVRELDDHWIKGAVSRKQVLALLKEDADE